MKTVGKFLFALFALCMLAVPIQGNTQMSALLSVAEAMAVNEEIEAWDASRNYNVHGTEEGIKVLYEGNVYQLKAGQWSPAGCKPSEWTTLWELVGDGGGSGGGDDQGGSGGGSDDDDISNTDHQMVGGLKKHLIIGYWHNFRNGLTDGGEGMKLSDANTAYDFLNVSFGETDASDRATITFVLDNSIYASDAEFIADIQKCQARGQKVNLSLGGQNGIIDVTDEAGKTRFVNSVIRIIEKYGFDGLDIDFEGSSAGGSYQSSFDNPTAKQQLMIDGIRAICDHFGPNFILTMAPETAYVQFGINVGSAPAYLPLIYGLRDKLTVLHVQLYNTGGSSDLYGNNQNPGTADYLVAMCEMMLQGFSNSGKTFPALAQDQVAMGIPAGTGAGNNAVSMDVALKAMKYLITGQNPGGINYQLKKSDGYPDFRGIMTWSVNWDRKFNDQLATTFNNYFNEIGNPIIDGDDTSDTEAPTTPGNLNGTPSANSIALSWSASTDNVAVRGYNVYVNGSRVGSTTSTSYTATGLTANTSYTIEVEAYDAAGNKSGKASVSVKTSEQQGGGSTISAAPTPTQDAANVKAIYSGKYSSPTLSVPEWAYQWLKTSENGLEKVSLDGDEALHLNTFNFAAYDLSSTINAADMEYLHLDVYAANGNAITFHPNGSETVYIGKTLTAGQWNSFDIPLSSFSGFDFSNVNSFKLTGENGADADGTKEYYIDNIYFWKNGSGDDQGGGDQGGGDQGGGNQGDGSGDYKFVVYFPNWGTYNANHQNVTVGMIPWNKVTHINHGFWTVGNDYKIVTTDEWSDFQKADYGHGDGFYNPNIPDSELQNGHFAEYRYYKSQYPNVKVLISVGGWTKGQNFHAMALTADRRAIFIQSVIDTFKKYPYIDGLDIDWEYPGVDRAKDPNDEADMGCPGGPEDKVNFVSLLKELRAAYSANGMSDKLLTMAASMNSNTVAQGPSPSDYAQYLDFINIMTYDAHGAFESVTNHHAAIYPSPDDPCEGYEKTFNAMDAGKLYRSYGIPANKLIIGSPWYSRGWGGVSAGPSGTGLYQTATGKYVGTWDAAASPGGQSPWFQIKQLENNGTWRKYFDEKAYVPYLYDGSNFLTYEDETSLSERCNFVKKYGYGGIIVWEISGDNLTGGTPMTNIVYNELFVDTTIKQTHEPVTDAIGVIEVETKDDAFYTLTGAKVLRPQRGIYIHHGKKVVIR